VLLTADERLGEERFEWMRTLLDAGDPDGQVGAAWVAKELLRDVYSAMEFPRFPGRVGFADHATFWSGLWVASYWMGLR